MKKLFIILILLPFFEQAQSLKYSAFLAPNFSGYKSEFLTQIAKPPIKKWGFGASYGFITEYFFQKTFSIGTSINYFLTRAELYTPCYFPYITDRAISIRNLISTHSMEVPVFLKLRTNKNENRFTYLQTGVGLSGLLNAHRKVEIETNFLGGPKDFQREQISNESCSLKNNSGNGIGSFIQFGIGRNVQIKRINLFFELSYRQDLNFWKYKTLETPDGVKEFPIQRQGILLKTGIVFNQKKT